MQSIQGWYFETQSGGIPLAQNVRKERYNFKDADFPFVFSYSADDSNGGGLEKYKTSVILHANGYNEWNAPASFTSTCKINVANFPFDKQNCSLKFGSWTFQGDRLTMASSEKSADLNLFM